MQGATPAICVTFLMTSPRPISSSMRKPGRRTRCGSRGESSSVGRPGGLSFTWLTCRICQHDAIGPPRVEHGRCERFPPPPARLNHRVLHLCRRSVGKLRPQKRDRPGDKWCGSTRAANREVPPARGEAGNRVARSARRTRPPSIGNAGNRLKRTSITLMVSNWAIKSLPSIVAC